MSISPGEDKESIKAGLKTWWSSFTKLSKSSKDRKTENQDRVFGEPLRKSLKYASVAISMTGDDGNQYVWGYVPIIVAKVGLFLKEHATEVEGVFRIAGSQKRMRDLQETFDTGPKYGKNVVWDKYMVHDAASVLRRYLNQMPEPIVPLDLYSEFRNVMHKQPLDVEAATKTYRLLVKSMPPANQYLLLYVLDLLAVFARKSDVNRMPASNLAVIFQPGIFSHPSHLQDANEHKLAVEVLEFLIEHQDHFVLRISQPAPTKIEALDLTAVSSIHPGLQPYPDVAELSDSDEELGVLTMHEGGGAKLARRSTTASAGEKKKQGGMFKSRKSGGPDTTTTTAAATTTTTTTQPASTLEVSPVATETSTPRTSTAKGEIVEVGLGDASSATGYGALRRSRTVPSRRVKDDTEEKRSVSSGKTRKKGARSTSRSTSKPSSSTGHQDAEPVAQSIKTDQSIDPIAEAASPTETNPPTDLGLPTPPPSKLISTTEQATLPEEQET